jgi:hypothetical protein
MHYATIVCICGVVQAILPNQIMAYSQGEAVEQISIPWVEPMPRLPEPLVMRDWAQVSKDYYRLVLNASTQLGGKATIAPKQKQWEPIDGDYVRTSRGQRGWAASYFSGATRTASPVLERVDETVDFNWQHGTPDSKLERDDFTVRWEGVLRPEVSREYTFWLQADDGARVTIEGRVLFDELEKPFQKTERLYLRNDYNYRVVIDYIERSGPAKVAFKWDYPLPDVSQEERVNYAMPSYLGGGMAQEVFTCLSPVVGARLMGQDLRAQVGFDYIQSAKNWYDEVHGLYRHGPGKQSPVLHSGIYGYWSSVYGLMLADLYPGDQEFQQQADSIYANFLKIAKGMGCPDNPDYFNLGFNLKTGLRDGRNEPMNRLGNAPNVAWICLLGYDQLGDPDMLQAARSTMEWYIENPGRYEATYFMGPLTVARMNAEHGQTLPMGPVLNAWFGDGERKMHPWHVTQTSRFGEIDCAGLDAAKWKLEEGSFHAFTMSSLLGPSWIVPVVRYDQRYAKSIARYVLNAANSIRLLQGFQLDGDHQDHGAWKDEWDPNYLLFYEALMPWEPSREKQFRPYATGDPIKNGWDTPKVRPEDYLAEKEKWFSKSDNNLALYMGNHVGFLGAICELTEVPGILKWDCRVTDWHAQPSYPTTMIYNPHATKQQVALSIESPTDLYDSVSGQFIARNLQSDSKLTLEPDQVMVLVEVPAGARLRKDGSHLIANDIVIDFLSNAQLISK